jgi:tetratricopeptide (TPR) repeat protein
MVPQPDDPHAHNEETYDQLISLIENSQGRLAPIIVSCDDSSLRQRIIMRYESEARQAEIRPYRIMLGQEPSMRAGLEALKQQEEYLQQDGSKAVFTVMGAELLLRVKLNTQDEQSELDKFFGYLQWTREGLREFRYPIVLWVTQRILREMSHRAPDFWSWRKAVLRFADESRYAPRIPIVVAQSQQAQENSEAEFSPSLAELQAEIAELTARDPAAPGLATLSDRLGQVYAQRISQAAVENLEQEREQAILAFQRAIRCYQMQNNRAAEMWALGRLGYFFQSQSLYSEAINSYQVSLGLARTIGDCDGEAVSLNNLGTVYHHLGEYQRAIDFYHQSLELNRRVGDRNSEASPLNNLGNTYNYLGAYERAITFLQQSLEIQRKIGDRKREADSLINLGNAYYGLGEYERAIDFYQQSLEIQHKIGERHCEAFSLSNLAGVLAKIGQSWQALQHYQKAKQIFQSLGLEHKAEECAAAIYALNRVIAVQQPTRAPRIDNQPSSPRPSSRQRRQLFLWFCFLAGVAIVLLVWRFL